MKFLVDRCAGRRLADWLREQGHDVLESRSLGPDPGDLVLLQRATSDNRVLVTLDTDFARLVFLQSTPHAGLVRLPDVPSSIRVRLMAAVLQRHAAELEARAIVTVRGNRIRISSPPGENV